MVFVMYTFNLAKKVTVVVFREGRFFPVIWDFSKFGKLIFDVDIPYIPDISEIIQNNKVHVFFDVISPQETELKHHVYGIEI